MAEIGHTATTELATHLLPVTSQFERADLNLNTYRYSPPLLPPVGDRWPTWKVMAALGAHLGVEVLPPGLDPRPAPSRSSRWPLGPAVGVPLVDPLETGTTALADVETTNGWAFDTGGWVHNVLLDGRWQLAPRVLVAQLRELFEAPVNEDGADSVAAGTARQLQAGRSGLTRRPPRRAGDDGAPRSRP